MLEWQVKQLLLWTVVMVLPRWQVAHSAVLVTVVEWSCPWGPVKKFAP